MNVRNESLARAAAESGLELTAEYVKSTPDWRGKFNPGIWIQNASFGEGSFSVAVYDMMDSDFANNEFHPAVITSVGRVNNVAHTSRAGIRPYEILVGHWKMDETGGTTIIDTKGGNHGSYHNGIALGQSGVIGNCAYFPGNTSPNSFGLVPDSQNFHLKEGAFSFWFNTQRTNVAQGLISRDNCFYGTGGHFLVFLEWDRLVYRLQSTSDECRFDAKPVIGSILTNRWYHVAATWGRQGMKLYVDGVLIHHNPGCTIGIDTNTLDLSFGATQFQICSGDPNWPLQGWLDDIRLYAAQLTDAEVAILANVPTPPKPNLGHWTLDETSGPTVADTVGGRNGTVMQYSQPFIYDQPGVVNKAIAFPGNYENPGVANTDYLNGSHITVNQGGAYAMPNGSFSIWFNVDIAKLQALKGGNFQSAGLVGIEQIGITDGDLTVFVEPHPLDNNKCRLGARLQNIAACGGDANRYKIYGNTQIAGGEWHHVAFTFGSNGMKVYLDGQLEAQDGYTGGTQGNTQPLVIGNTNWNTFTDKPTNVKNPFGGLMDDVGLFDYQLTEAQIQLIFNSASAPYDPKFVRYDVRYEAD